MSSDCEIARLREIAVCVAWKFHMVPYKYGGPERRGNPQEPDYFGVDCSGVTSAVLQSVGILAHRERLWVSALLGRFAQFGVRATAPGVLAFYGDPAKHVMICLDCDLVIGTVAGVAEVDTLAEAISQDARVKVRPLKHRADRLRLVDPFLSIRGGS